MLCAIQKSCLGFAITSATAHGRSRRSPLPPGIAAAVPIAIVDGKDFHFGFELIAEAMAREMIQAERDTGRVRASPIEGSSTHL